LISNLGVQIGHVTRIHSTMNQCNNKSSMFCYPSFSNPCGDGDQRWHLIAAELFSGVMLLQTTVPAELSINNVEF